MKKLTFIILFGALGFYGKTQNVTNDFEQGTRPYYQALCWQFGGVSLSNVSPISGIWSGRTGSLSNPSPNSFWVYSPWVKFSGSGNLEFNHKLLSFGGTWKRIRVLLGNPNDTTTIFLFQYDYQKPADVNRVISESVPVNHTGVYRVIWNFYGTGGNDRIMIDDITIPAPYWSDPSNNCQPLPAILDTDGDGVPDDQDAYPYDPYRAFNNYYPSSDTATLAFEDNWPAYGDYDMNDLVMGYKFKIVSNAQHNVVEVFNTLILRANGASMENGFGYQFPDVNPGSVISVTGTGDQTGYIINANGTETGNSSKATIIVFDRSHRYMPQWNTIKGVPTVDYVRFNIYLQFMNNGVPGPAGAVSINTLNISGWNPFMVVNGQRGREVHLPDYLPTDLADQSLFRTSDDDTQPGIGKYYKSPNNLPWALDIFGKFDYPIEKQDISGAYLHFADWVLSNGTSYPDWWSNTGTGYRDNAKIY